MSVIDDIKSLHADTLSAIGKVPNTDALEKIRVEVVGKSGTLTGYLRAMGQVAKEHRAEVGKTVNAARNEIEAALEAKKRELAHAELEARMESRCHRHHVAWPLPADGHASLDQRHFR